MKQLRPVPLFKNYQKLPSGLLLPADVKPPPRKPLALDLFAGAGGFSLGFIQAGWNVVAALDYSADALTTYWYNLCNETSRWIGSQETTNTRDNNLAHDRKQSHPF